MAKSITKNGKTYRLGYSVKFIDDEIIPDESPEITDSDIDAYEAAELEDEILNAALNEQEDSQWDDSPKS